MATSYADVLARNVRAARARARIDQATVARRMSGLGFGAWVRQTVTKVERGSRRITAEEILGLSVALETTVQALMLPANEDDGITLPSGIQFPGHGVQTSVLGYAQAAWWDSKGEILPFPTQSLPQPDRWPPMPTLRGSPVETGEPDVSDATRS